MRCRRLFTVLATENPIEYEGTYPLPEAQLDRFLLKIVLSYPSADEEHQVIARWDAGFNARRLDQVEIQPLADADGNFSLPGRSTKYAGRARGATLHSGYRPAYARSRGGALRRQSARRGGAVVMLKSAVGDSRPRLFHARRRARYRATRCCVIV